MIAKAVLGYKIPFNENWFKPVLIKCQHDIPHDIKNCPVCGSPVEGQLQLLGLCNYDDAETNFMALLQSYLPQPTDIGVVTRKSETYKAVLVGIVISLDNPELSAETYLDTSSLDLPKFKTTLGQVLLDMTHVTGYDFFKPEMPFGIWLTLEQSAVAAVESPECGEEKN